jgi:hypothetical protein
MPEGKDRRLKPRFNVSLPCAVALPEGERDLLFPDALLRCRTRDLSETGVGLEASSIYLGYACVVDEGRRLLLQLDLPADRVEMLTEAAHYVRLDRAGEESVYLIGLRITEMSGPARELFNAYLSALAAAGVS